MFTVFLFLKLPHLRDSSEKAIAGHLSQLTEQSELCPFPIMFFLIKVNAKTSVTFMHPCTFLYLYFKCFFYVFIESVIFVTCCMCIISFINCIFLFIFHLNKGVPIFSSLTFPGPQVSLIEHFI